MKMKDEIIRLFQKFPDNSFIGKELERFQALLDDAETAERIRRLVAGLWDYLAVTENHKSNKFQASGQRLLQQKQHLLERLMDDNERHKEEIIAAMGKIRCQDGTSKALHKKKGFWRWIKRFFVRG